MGGWPHVSPNGRLLVYLSFKDVEPSMMAMPASGGKPRILLHRWQDQPTLAWSPDSRTIAAVTGNAPGTKRLVILNATSGKVLRTIASGIDFFGASFSPDGSRLVYARAPAVQGSDLYRADVYTIKLSGGRPVALTRDHYSSWPVWGREWIVFSRSRKPTRPGDSRKLDLYLVRPSGAGLHRLTRTQPGPGKLGLVPTAWSANGKRLLAELNGELTTFAETVDPVTGRVRRVGTPAQGLIGFALSRDGSTILAASGGPLPADGNVVAIPYNGGKLRVLARHARMPDWNAAHAPGS